ncbi:MAG TPA: DNA-directed RNA polymerase subunit alpha [Armatimonadetes bacterium]|nr:DNA-directed RNA polymerase subunit alpha [Armatimonadota bacterium]
MIKVAGREPTVEVVRLTPDYGKFIIEPLPHGYGTTIGNALRRVLLSSVPGVAITSATIDGVAHEYTTLPGVREDMTELILNLKEVALQFADGVEVDPDVPQEFRAQIQAEGVGEVTAADLVFEGPEVVVVNPELHLAQLTTETASLAIELVVETGVGYIAADDHDTAETGLSEGGKGLIPVDSMFTPVRRVNHTVEQTRVGHLIDLDRLILEVWTNAALGPRQALGQAARILDAYMQLFTDLPADALGAGAGRGGRAEAGRVEGGEAKIEELEFQSRTYNALKKERIDTIGELVRLTEREVLEIRGLGSISVNEIKERLAERGLSLASDEG